MQDRGGHGRTGFSERTAADGDRMKRPLNAEGNHGLDPAADGCYTGEGDSEARTAAVEMGDRRLAARSTHEHSPSDLWEICIPKI